MAAPPQFLKGYIQLELVGLQTKTVCHIRVHAYYMYTLTSEDHIVAKVFK